MNLEIYTPELLRLRAPELWSLLEAHGPLELARKALLDRIQVIEFNSTNDGSDDDGQAFELSTVRDCARAWRSILNPRSEHLAGFSVLSALHALVRGQPEADLSPAFLAEMIHLCEGLEGRARIYSSGWPNGEPIEGRAAALRRSAELDELSQQMDAFTGRYRHGLEPELIAARRENRERILASLGAPAESWSSWSWQVRNIATSAAALARLTPLEEGEVDCIDRAVRGNLPFGVTPYYASLFDRGSDRSHDRGLRSQVIPPHSYIDAMLRYRETKDPSGDFMLEQHTSPVDLVTRRYPGIVILKPYNTCPQICVYCQRNWEIRKPMQEGAAADSISVARAIAWIREHPAIHEVLVTGGDPLLLGDNRLRALLEALAACEHVERIRIGTRMPVVVPMRITDRLAEMLASFCVTGRREICVVTHVQYPYEVTPELGEACDRLRRQGIPVYNQLVYVFGISRRFEASLLRRLLRRIGVEPYYTFNTKGKAETVDYQVPLARLMQEQREEARLLPGLARTDEAVYNVPGLGKNHLRAWQHRDLISVRPDGVRVYEFHPWEKKIVPQQNYVGDNVPILDYLRRLAALGEDPADYHTIWYYF